MISRNTAGRNHTILLAMCLLYRRTKNGDVSAAPENAGNTEAKATPLRIIIIIIMMIIIAGIIIIIS